MVNNNFNPQNGMGTNTGFNPVSYQYPYTNPALYNTPYDNYMGNNRVNQTNQTNLFLKCRPVSSKEEARAFQIDLDGSLWVFTDVGNDKIYTKQVNSDGTATFKTYILTQDENPYAQPEYVTKEEFEKVIQSLRAAAGQIQKDPASAVIRKRV